MSQDITKVLRWSINWSNALIMGKVADLPDDDLFRPVSPVAPSIGWHVWHITRWSDMFHANLAETTTLWDERDLLTIYGLARLNLGALATGVGLNTDQACLIPQTIGKAHLLTYAADVNAACKTVMRTFKPDDMTTLCKSIYPADLSIGGLENAPRVDVPIINEFVFHGGHVSRHLGMIEALIGATLHQSGTATI